MRFQFNAHQAYQLEAIDSVVRLFQGQPANAELLRTALAVGSLANDTQDVLDLSLEVGAIRNHFVLDDETVLENLQAVQNENGLEISSRLIDGLQFDIEMETGTGKTYVYLRTAFELARKYNFTKFIILVPSVAIREGVRTSIQLMAPHFRELYPDLQFDSLVYSGDRAEEVRDFTTSTSVQFLIMTLASLRGDKNTRIMHQYRDQLNGLRPLDFLQATHPVVIMDEPQNMESTKAKSAIPELNPLCTLRYSATHREKRNMVYRLDPVDAHEAQLVKQIVVSSTVQEGFVTKPYVRLIEVRRNSTPTAKLELLVRKKDGSIARKTVTAKNGCDLEILSNENPVYSGNWRINEISSSEPAFIELTNYGRLWEGTEIGGSQDAVFKEMIRETIKEHFRREAKLHSQGVKVLSLFFIDKVASYIGEGHNNRDACGKFAVWFDELYREEFLNHKELSHLPDEPIEVRRGYFAEMSKGKGKDKVVTFKDSSGSTKADDDAYELIMKDKARLLNMDEPVRFIFSHSALREGWDNPNVFQICTLRDMGSDTERRQTIGRGLRLPVNRNGERISDRGIAQLTIIANESYTQFAAALQDDYIKAGVSIGRVRPHEFAKIPIVVDGKEQRLGTKKSEVIRQTLENQGFINNEGEVQPSFAPEALDFHITMPEEFKDLENQIVDIVANCRIEQVIKPKKRRVVRKLNKELLFYDPGFEEFWEKITRKTTYHVALNHKDFIDKCVTAIKDAPKIDPIRIKLTRTNIEITRGGARKGDQEKPNLLNIKEAYLLPDIISQIQESTSLTRRTIIDILKQSERLEEFLHNPHDFIAMVSACIKDQLSHVLINGVQYERIGGHIYELRELQAAGQAEKDRFLDNLYQVKNKEKTDFDYIIIDSEVERKFAEHLDSNKDIKLFMKLPSEFKIPTPVGAYNPDWAIIKEEQGQQHLYLIRETKSSQDPLKRRPTENAKITAAKRHFAAIEVDYMVSTPQRWEI